MKLPERKQIQAGTRRRDGEINRQKDDKRISKGNYYFVYVTALTAAGNMYTDPTKSTLCQAHLPVKQREQNRLSDEA